MLKFIFDLQRFGGGKGGTTVTQTYEPTEWELGLQQLEFNFVGTALIPNATHLSTIAVDHLQESGAEIPVHYDDLFLDADVKITEGLSGLKNSLGDLTDNAPPTATAVAMDITQANQAYLDEIFDCNDKYLDGLIGWINDIPVELYR